jgi:LTXXQ motif family protein
MLFLGRYTLSLRILPPLLRAGILVGSEGHNYGRQMPQLDDNTLREASMQRTISAGMTALAVIAGPSLGYAQSPAAGPLSQRITAADLNALTDARVAIVKGALQLTPDQERYWPAIEEAIRSRAKDRQTRLESVTTGAAERADRSPIENLRDRSPVEFLNRRADALAQRSADLKKLASAWQPLYQTMMPDQKRRMGFVAVYVLRELRDSAEERRIQAAEED